MTIGVQNEDDLEQSYFGSIRRGGDRTFGYLLALIVVSFFFSLFFIGMYRTQSISDQIASEHSRPALQNDASEIGDSASNR